MASADWVAKVWSSSMTSGAKAPGVFLLTVSPPISSSSRSSGTARSARSPAAEEDVAEGPAIDASARDVGNLDRLRVSPPCVLGCPLLCGIGVRRARAATLLVQVVGGAELEASVASSYS